MTLLLPSSHSIPVIGLGTWQAAPEIVENAVATALDNGYRLIDTAFNYGNEEAIGRAIKKWISSGGEREELFITTKLPNFGNRASDVEKYLTQSLKKLGLEYLDLYLIHHPFGFLAPPPGTEPPELDHETNHIEIWKALEEQVKLKRVRSIGLSNFNAHQIEEIATKATVPPSNLQVELHLYLQQPELLETCQRLSITITAYAPLGSPHAKSHFKAKYGIESSETGDPLTDAKVLEIASRTGATPAQVLLKFLIQSGIIVIPKSASPERILENYKALDVVLTKDDMHSLKALNKGEAGRIFDFLFYKGVENHPEYPFKKAA